MAFDSIALDAAVNVTKVPYETALRSMEFARIADTVVASLRYGTAADRTGRLEVTEQVWSIRPEVLKSIRDGELKPEVDVNAAAEAIARMRARKRLETELKRLYAGQTISMNVEAMAGEDQSAGPFVGEALLAPVLSPGLDLGVVFKNIRLLPAADAARILFVLAGKEKKADSILRKLPDPVEPNHKHGFAWQVASGIQKAVDQVYVQEDPSGLGPDATKLDLTKLPDSLRRFLPIYVKQAGKLLLTAKSSNPVEAAAAQGRIKAVADAAKRGDTRGAAMEFALQKAILFTADSSTLMGWFPQVVMGAASAWSPTASYNVGDQVTRNGKTWQCCSKSSSNGPVSGAQTDPATNPHQYGSGGPPLWTDVSVLAAEEAARQAVAAQQAARAQALAQQQAAAAAAQQAAAVKAQQAAAAAAAAAKTQQPQQAQEQNMAQAKVALAAGAMKPSVAAANFKAVLKNQDRRAGLAAALLLRAGKGAVAMHGAFLAGVSLAQVSPKVQQMQVAAAQLIKQMANQGVIVQTAPRAIMKAKKGPKGIVKVSGVSDKDFYTSDALGDDVSDAPIPGAGDAFNAAVEAATVAASAPIVGDIEPKPYDGDVYDAAGWVLEAYNPMSRSQCWRGPGGTQVWISGTLSAALCAKYNVGGNPTIYYVWDTGWAPDPVIAQIAAAQPQQATPVVLPPPPPLPAVPFPDVPAFQQPDPIQVPPATLPAPWPTQSSDYDQPAYQPPPVYAQPAPDGSAPIYTATVQDPNQQYQQYAGPGQPPPNYQQIYASAAPVDQPMPEMYTTDFDADQRIPEASDEDMAAAFASQSYDAPVDDGSSDYASYTDDNSVTDMQGSAALPQHLTIKQVVAVINKLDSAQDPRAAKLRASLKLACTKGDKLACLIVDGLNGGPALSSKQRIPNIGKMLNAAL